MIPNPPRRAGIAIRSRRVSLKAFWPVIAGSSLCLTTFFLRGLSKTSMFGVVLARYVHLLTIAHVSAAYAACGCVKAISERHSSSLFHSDTFPST